MRSTLAALVMSALTVVPAGAQEDPLMKSVVKLEEPGGQPRAETYVQPPPKELLPRRLYAVVEQVVIPAYPCCEPPEQFTLTAMNPFFRQGRSHAYVNFEGYYGKREIATQMVLEWRSYYPSLWRLYGRTSELKLRLKALKPTTNYLLDYRVGDRRALRVEGTTVYPTDGHILVVVSTDESGNAWVDLKPDSEYQESVVWDIVVSEIGPARR